jgi:hypothetical protein
LVKIFRGKKVPCKTPIAQTPNAADVAVRGEFGASTLREESY